MRNFLNLGVCIAAFLIFVGCSKNKLTHFAPNSKEVVLSDSQNINSLSPKQDAQETNTQDIDTAPLSRCEKKCEACNIQTCEDTKNTQSKQISKADESQSVEEKREVYVDEGIFYELGKGDAEFSLYGESYALVPKSNALKAFLNQQKSSFKARTLRSSNSMTQIYNEGKNILFYHSTTGSNLYAKIAPKRFKLTLEEWLNESKNPQEIESIYRIKNFDTKFLDSECRIVQTRAFVRDRARSEMLINLDHKINPKIASEGDLELFLECPLPKGSDDFRPSKRLL